MQWPNLSILIEQAGRAVDRQRALLESVADIAYIAGGHKHYSGDSRKDISDFIAWAEEFEKLRQVDAEENETYNGKDYMTAIEEFTIAKLEL